MNRLQVLLHGDLVGALIEDEPGQMEFEYTDAWLQARNAIPLSRSLPRQPGRFPTKQTLPFFAGVLPEEQTRRIIARNLGFSDANDMALLRALGGDCAGAVSVLSAGQEIAHEGASTRRLLSDSSLESLLAELPQRPLLAGEKGVRLSLAGARDKLPVILSDGGLHLPLEQTPSTHILKPEPGHYPGLALNEWFCMTLARSIGMQVPGVAYRRIGKIPCLVVERYDRRLLPDGHLQRIHQEDFCQALGHHPARKYQQEGGATIQDCLALIRSWSTAAVKDLPRFLDALIFNWIIGNADAHSKNYSFLYEDGKRVFAPLYDLVSTIHWPGLSSQPAMKLGNARSIRAFEGADWKKLARQNSLAWSLLKSRITQRCGEVTARVDGVRDSAAVFHEKLAMELHDAVLGRAEKLLAAAEKA